MTAFNVHIATELGSRLPPGVPVGTLHSLLGFATVRRVIRDCQVDETKLTKLARGLLPDAYPSVRQAGEQLARLCKYTLTPERNRDGLAELVDHYGLEIDDRDEERVLKLAGDLVELSAAELATVDFDDQIWLPVRMGWRPEQFDLLVVDEAQDLNRAQQSLARMATAEGRLFLLGDEHQAIMGFAGADCDALPNLTRRLEREPRGCAVLSLSVTWRCPASHVALANAIVPDLEAAPGAKDGTVKVLSRREIAESVRPGDLVICRKNAPVVSLTYRLVLAGVPAVMRGRDIGKGLLSLIARLKPDSVSHLVERTEDYREREDARLRRKDAPQSQFDSLEDRCDCLSQLATQATSLEDLERFIRSVFNDSAKPGASVVLSSVHRAKGLESERVYVLDPDSLPLIRRDSKPWQITQERNLCYIAATRSKDVLVFEDRIPGIFGR